MPDASHTLAPQDPCDPRWWTSRRLRPSAHAAQRCQERDILPLAFLPDDSRLVDRDLDDRGRLNVVVFKVSTEQPFFAVLGVDGTVITVFLNNKDKEYAEWQRVKQRRRAYQSRH